MIENARQRKIGNVVSRIALRAGNLWGYNRRAVVPDTCSRIFFAVGRVEHWECHFE